MSEMVERVARAIVESNHRANSIVSPWDKQPEFARELARTCARAAIAAMREPTDGMLEVAVCSPYDAIPRWHAMIDEALKD